MRSNTKLTTVKILKEVYSNFKKSSFESGITLQKLVNRTMHRYITDDTYRSEIDDYMGLEASGSHF